MTARLIRRAGALTLAAAATATVLTGCGAGVGAKLTYDDTEKAKITDIVIDGSSGDVAITTGAAAETRIKRTVRTDGRDPEISHHVTGSTLDVSTSCGDHCTVSYEITAPVGVKVKGSLDSGDLTLSKVGSADVRAGSGDILLDQIPGDVIARADSGSIQANALGGGTTLVAKSGDVMAHELTGGKAVKVTVDSGDISVGLAQPASVTARASSGDINLVVPVGDYKIVGPARRSDDGDELNTDLVSNPSAPNVLDLKASSGDASVVTSP
ncbi:DUF4097 family beta strand repeat-containing protein [Symbioplanes lichenis]|uniref:DUF4097 family beta strand repeat-containing protein n=1 Tax=Symbioplanes lichenis TaxID=1629072 RepID=UPI0027381CEA|nr:DUF4097 family beta strand repeat-containing protein [Actinoplanes lichenis]